MSGRRKTYLDEARTYHVRFGHEIMGITSKARDALALLPVNPSYRVGWKIVLVGEDGKVKRVCWEGPAR